LETILILDDDLGFVFWLGHLLDAAGYSTLPAKSIYDGAILVQQLGLSVSVLIVNLGMAGRLDFTAALRQSPRRGAALGTRVVGILNDPSDDADLQGVHAVRVRPSILNEAAKVEWLQSIQRVLSNYDTQVC
jgi:DNA-binding NarL/FixJ family response regulator